jgi:acyl-CoA synthetase (NDP forming)
VIGASEDPFTYSGASVANLLRTGFTGKIFPVNPRRATVQGLRAYPSLLDVPEPVDTAIVVVPTDAVLPVLADVSEKGIRTVTIVSSGFGEEAAGPAGIARAERLAEFIDETGIRVLGPNTAGLSNLLDAYVPRAANNGFDPERLTPGAVALVTQSGAMGNTVFNRAQAHGVGIGISVATGGQIDVDVWDLAELTLQDPRIRVAALIVEAVDGRRAEQVAREAAALDKAVVLLRLGRSEAGRAAVMTHSGSIAGDDVVQSAALRQLGMIEVDELDDLWQVAQLVETWGPPRGRVESFGVVALSGGEGALIADCCATYDIPLGGTSDAFGRVIADNFEYAAPSNPFDPSGEVIGRPEKVKLALRAFVEQNEFSDILIASPVLRDEIAQRQYADLHEIVAEPRPRIALSFWDAGDLTNTQEALLRGTGLPVFSSSRAAIRSLAAYASVADRVLAEPVAAPATAASPDALSPAATYFEVRAACVDLGLTFPDAVLAASRGEAVAAAERLGYPVVIKANVVSSTHKLANGLLALHLDSPDAVAAAFDRVARSGKAFDADGVVVEALGRGQFEVMLGAHRDPTFGAVVTFASGGSMVEYLNDAAVMVAHLMTDDDAWSLICGTQVGRYLSEHAPVAARLLADTIGRLSRWFQSNTQLDGVDLNPVVIDAVSDSVVCVDARVA